MKVHDLVYNFKLQAAAIDKKGRQQLSIPQVIIYLNEGQRDLLMRNYGPHNKYQASLESIQKRIDEWQRLIVPHEVLSMELRTDYNTSDAAIYTTDLKSTQHQYLFLLRCSFFAAKGQCENCRVYSQYTRSDSFNDDLDNPDTKPNFEWRRALHKISQDKLLGYTDSTFSLTQADIDYLRYPIQIDIEGYKHFDGTDSKNVDCELPEFLHSDVIASGVMKYKIALGHTDATGSVQAAQLGE